MKWVQFFLYTQKHFTIAMERTNGEILTRYNELSSSLFSCMWFEGLIIVAVCNEISLIVCPWLFRLISVIGFPFATHKSMFAHFLKRFLCNFQKLKILVSSQTWFFAVIFIKRRFANAVPNRHQVE